MTNTIAAIRAALAKRLLKTVDSLTDEMADLVERLEKTVETYDAIEEHHAYNALLHDAKAAHANSEARKASALADKLRDLIPD